MGKLRIFGLSSLLLLIMVVMVDARNSFTTRNIIADEANITVGQNVTAGMLCTNETGTIVCGLVSAMVAGGSGSGDHTNLTGDDLIRLVGNASGVNTTSNIKLLGFNTTVQLDDRYAVSGAVGGDHTNLTGDDLIRLVGNASGVNTTANIELLGFVTGTHTNLTQVDIFNLGFFNESNNVTVNDTTGNFDSSKVIFWGVSPLEWIGDNLQNIIGFLTTRMTTINSSANIERLVNNTYVNRAGDNMTGSLNMTGNNISGVNAIVFDDENSFISLVNQDFGGLENSFNFFNGRVVSGGKISHSFTQDSIVLATWQVGLPLLAGFHRNSLIISGDFNITNATILSNCDTMINLSSTPRHIGCNTSSEGAGVWVQGPVQFGQDLFLGDTPGLNFFQFHGETTLFAENTTVLISEGDLTIRMERLEEVGFNLGDNVSRINELFEDGEIDPFVNDPANTVNFDTAETAECHDSVCMHNTGAGSNIQIVFVNYSSLDIRNQTTSFWLTTGATWAGADSFNVSVNNFTGSGWVQLYAMTGIVSDLFVNRSLDGRFDNTSVVGLRYLLDSRNNREMWIDESKMYGNASASTLNNETRVEGKIIWGDGVCITRTVHNVSGRFLINTCPNIINEGNVTELSITVVSENVTGTITAEHVLGLNDVNATTFFVGGVSVIVQINNINTSVNMLSLVGEHRNLTGDDLIRLVGNATGVNITALKNGSQHNITQLVIGTASMTGNLGDLNMSRDLRIGGRAYINSSSVYRLNASGLIFGGGG